MGVHTTYETLLYFGCRPRHWRYDSIRAYIFNREPKHDSRLAQRQHRGNVFPSDTCCDQTLSKVRKKPAGECINGLLDGRCCFNV
jgi:hypothetical protein